MLIYNDTFLKIKALLTPHILKFVKENQPVDSTEIHRHIFELKQSDPDQFVLVSFAYNLMSLGRCEVCGKYAINYDVHHNYLPKK